MSNSAVLIGINRYNVPGADLRGCVNDVVNVRSVLLERFAFSDADIRVLTDHDATKAAMQTQIDGLVSEAEAGDVLVLFFAGHGSNVPDADGDEADHRDEILCPTDLDWKDPLTDDWLRDAIDQVPDEVNLTVIMDCCHSGSNTRAIEPPDAPVIPRYLPSPWDLVAAESGRALRGDLAGKRRALQRSVEHDVVVAGIPEMLLTGCRDDQTSADAFIDGSYNGAFTHSLVSVIRNSPGPLSYRDLHAATRLSLKRRRFVQTPQLEGLSDNFDRPFLAPF